MTLQTILGKKLEQSQKFLEDGRRIPVTRIWVKGNVVVSVKTNDKDHYSALQIGFGEKKRTNKAMAGHIKGAKLEKAPKFLKEVRTDEVIEPGASLVPSELLAEGDIVDVTGVSKGKGYAGVVKRHGFRGGPRTHGQSDRERAPGSIGQTTTPGRVYKGKRMAGRMGNENVTIKNLVVVGVTEDEILVKGLVPGSVNTMVIVKKVGEMKKFVPLFGIKAEEPEVSEVSSQEAPIEVEKVESSQEEVVEVVQEEKVAEEITAESPATVDVELSPSDSSEVESTPAPAEEVKEEKVEEEKENAS